MRCHVGWWRPVPGRSLGIGSPRIRGLTCAIHPFQAVVLIIMRGGSVIRSKKERSPPEMGAYAAEASTREATSSNSKTFAMSNRGAIRPGASPTNLGPVFCSETFCCPAERCSSSVETAANEPKPASALRRSITVFFIGSLFSPGFDRW